MDKLKKLRTVMGAYGGTTNLDVVAAQVKSVDGESCTVTIGDLELTDVRLKATINGQANKILQFPKIGSTVLLGSLTGDLRDLVILKIDELEKVEYTQGSVKIMIDSSGKLISIEPGQLSIKFDGNDNKVSVSNSGVSLKTLFDDLKEILEQFKVLTANGPSSGLLPDTITRITTWGTKYGQLLK
jgi:hypothetical protein